MTFRLDRTANLPPRTCPSSTNYPRHRLQPPVGGGRRSSLAMRRLVIASRERSSTRPKETGGAIRRQSLEDSRDGEQFHPWHDLSRPRRSPSCPTQILGAGIHTRTFYRTDPGIKLTLSDDLARSLGVGFPLSGFLRSFRLCSLASLSFGHFLSALSLPQPITENDTASVVLLVRS
jgi:hypothetical protein